MLKYYCTISLERDEAQFQTALPNDSSNFILFTISQAIHLENGLLHSVRISHKTPYFAGQRHQIAVINSYNVSRPTWTTIHTDTLISFSQRSNLCLGNISLSERKLIKLLIVSCNECYLYFSLRKGYT